MNRIHAFIIKSIETHNLDAEIEIPATVNETLLIFWPQGEID